MVPQERNHRVVQGGGQHLATAARLVVAFVELVAMLEDQGASREVADRRPLEAGADAGRRQGVPRSGLAQLVVVVARHERDRRRFGEPRERFECHRIALAHGAQ